tara:strand:+ start:619 stop:1596 length:978 start_codon:yes stop_codon:yes gene_type:complete
MNYIKIPKSWEISESEVTSESSAMNRRQFLKGTSAIAFYGAMLYAGCSRASSPIEEGITLNEIEKEIYPAQRNLKYTLDCNLTEEKEAASYNNFYEFSSDKKDPSNLAQELSIRPWTVEVKGLVGKPRTFHIDDLLKYMPIEERLYRFRCVEAWAMVVPWTGFPLKALLRKVEPLKQATHVRFTTFHKPLTARGQLAFWYPWPYTEGLTLEEAMNELTFVATGIYGHPLPKQHGAPLRLVVPWKYGYKGAKSIVSIELLDYQPSTFWTTLQAKEYDFVANVNPRIAHPRWLQTREKMVGTGEERLTRLFNGYRDQVAYLYPGQFF